MENETIVIEVNGERTTVKGDRLEFLQRNSEELVALARKAGVPKETAERWFRIEILGNMRDAQDTQPL